MNMHNPNTDGKLYEPAMVKEALCRHFNMPPDRSHLTTCEKHFIGLGGNQFHYYRFTLKDGHVKRQAFGKLGGANAREYQALQHLMENIPDERRHFCRPIALLKDGNRSMLLLEYLEGYSNALSMANSLRLFPSRASNITRLATDILDKIYGLQQHFPLNYSPLSSEDADAIPGQPVPTGIFKQLEDIKSLSIETKAAVRDRINAILKNQIPVRRGVIHGQLGMRNIMLNRSCISFIDWEYMESNGLCLYDPCYIATMALMRGVQLVVSRSKLNQMSDALFQHIEGLEERLADAEHKAHIRDSLWFAKCLAMIDTLWQYETTKGSRLRALAVQERRKIDYLAFCIENDARKDKSNSYAINRWNLHSDHYIKVSKRRSSSALVTAGKFIEMAGISKGSKVLDLGCGHGRIVEILVEKVPSLDIVGVDMTRNLLDNFTVKSGANESKIDLICGDITKLPLADNGFDAVVSSRVFQYLPDPVLGVREAFRVLKPGGVFVVAIPNKLNVIKYLTYDASLYSPFQVRDWFKACGFEDINYGSIGFFPSSGRWKGVAAALEIAGKIPLVKHLGGNVLVMGRKKPQPPVMK